LARTNARIAGALLDHFAEAGKRRGFNYNSDLVLRSHAQHGVSKDDHGPQRVGPSFETALRPQDDVGKNYAGCGVRRIMPRCGL
jgi:hypothetical protein